MRPVYRGRQRRTASQVYHVDDKAAFSCQERYLGEEVEWPLIYTRKEAVRTELKTEDDEAYHSQPGSTRFAKLSTHLSSVAL